MVLAGDLQQIDVPNLVEMVKQIPLTCLTLFSHGRRWSIYMQDSEIVHATNGTQSGMEALYQALACHQGIFYVETETAAPERTVNQPWTTILLDWLQQIDEQTITLTSLAEKQENEDLGISDDFYQNGTSTSITYESGHMHMAGQLNEEGVAPILKIAQQRKKSARIRLRNDKEWYELYVTTQGVVHVRTAHVTGIEAFYEMLLCATGLFVLDENIDLPEQNITIRWEALESERRKHLSQIQDYQQRMTRLLSSMANDMGRDQILNLSVIREDGRLISQLGEQTLSASSSMLFLQMAQTILGHSKTAVHQFVLALDNGHLVGRQLEDSPYYLIGVFHKVMGAETIQLFMQSYTKRMLNVITEQFNK